MNRSAKYITDLITVLTAKEMKIRYKNNVLGYFWSVLQPLSFALVYFIAFKIVMRIEMENYTLFLITGMFPWQWFANSINESSNLFISNQSIIKKINFPRNTLVIASICNDCIHFMLSIPVIILFFFIYDVPLSINLAWCAPLLLILQFTITYSISLFIATINLFFRDMARLVPILMTFLFFLTPIIYSFDMVPDKYKYLVSLNPVAPLMVSWRNLFLYGQVNIEYVLIAFGYSMIFLMIGQMTYKKLVWKFAEVL
tara:strand:+ start:809 stop:1576 length:768 start_codon:yes stop_codon:yes gene_type:complete